MGVSSLNSYNYAHDVECNNATVLKTYIFIELINLSN